MFISILAVLVIVIDQITKHIAVQILNEGSIQVIKGFFHLTLVQNSGAAFGVLQNGKILFLLVTPVIIVSILVYVFFYARRNHVLSTASALIIGGALGNYIDRIRLGYVLDFLDFRVWPVFNIADSAVVVGTCIFAFYMIFMSEKEPRREESKGEAD